MKYVHYYAPNEDYFEDNWEYFFPESKFYLQILITTSTPLQPNSITFIAWLIFHHSLSLIYISIFCFQNTLLSILELELT